MDIMKFRCYMFCFVLPLTDVPLKLPFTRMENLLENTGNKTDSTADFIVFPPFNLGFLLTSVFFFCIFECQSVGGAQMSKR